MFSIYIHAEAASNFLVELCLIKLFHILGSFLWTRMSWWHLRLCVYIYFFFLMIFLLFFVLLNSTCILIRWETHYEKGLSTLLFVWPHHISCMLSSSFVASYDYLEDFTSVFRSEERRMFEWRTFAIRSKVSPSHFLCWMKPLRRYSLHFTSTVN